jgi:uncharacterized protein
MTIRYTILITIAPVLLFAGTSESAIPIKIRERQQAINLITAPSATHDRAILFLPGDGGWRGLAITVASTISSWGYDVYALDTKSYLETFGGVKRDLTENQMQKDLRDIARWIRSRGATKVIIVGWSQGAGMGILAAQAQATPLIDGVITLGLPQSAFLAWNWSDNIAVLARREPDEPHFPIQPLLPAMAPTPVLMIHGARDEYTSPQAARQLYALTSEPKRLIEIDGGNHRFDGKRSELYKALQEGLAWLGGPRQK